jgi:hypothetical protein
LRRRAFGRILSLMLADEKSSPEQVEIFRAMTGERRLQLAEQLY